MAYRINYIDFLKGIAAFMVVLVHASFIGENVGIVSRLYVGQMGCQLFFLLSGVTASISLSRNNIKKFYSNRLYGILPIAWVSILLFYFCDSRIFLEEYRAFQFAGSHNIIDILSNVFLVNGIFQCGNNNVIPGGWFIGCLVLLYAISPLVVKLVDWIYKKSSEYVMFVPIIIFYTGYYVDYIFTIISQKFFNDIFVIGYNSMIMQLSPFIYGVIAYHELVNKDEKSNNKIFLLIVTTLLGLVSICNYYLKLITGNVFIWSTFFFFLFWLVNIYWNKIQDLKIVKIFEKMGRVSFTMLFSHYLVFIYFIPIVKLLFSKIGITTSGDFGWLLMMIITMPVIYVVSVLYKLLVDGIVSVLTRMVITCKKSN